MKTAALSDAQLRRLGMVDDVVVSAGKDGKPVKQGPGSFEEHAAWLKKMGRSEDADHLRSRLPVKS